MSETPKPARHTLTDAQYDRAIDFILSKFSPMDLVGTAERLYAVAADLQPDPLARMFVFALCIKRLETNGKAAGMTKVEELIGVLLALVDQMDWKVTAS